MLVLFFCVCLAVPCGLSAQDYRSESLSVSHGDANSAVFITVGGVQIDFAGTASSQQTKPKSGKGSRSRSQSWRYVGPGFSMHIGFNNFTTPDYSAYPADERYFLDITGKSISFSLMAFGVGVESGRRRNRRFFTGLAMKWDNYVFSGITLGKGDDGMIHPVPIDEGYKKSKLTTFAIHVPLAFGFKLGPMRMETGVYGDMIVKSFTKYNRPKHKTHGAFGVRMFQPGVMFSLGVKNLSFYANYSIMPFFKDGVGPKTHVYTLGIKVF